MSTPLSGTVSLRYRLVTAAAHKLLNAMIGPFAVIYLEREVGAAWAGAMVASGALAGVVAGLAGGTLTDRFGRRPVLIVGEFGAAVMYAAMAACVLPSVAQPVPAYGFLLLATTLSTLTLPAHEALILDLTDAGNRSRIYMINYWSVNLAMGIGGIAGGLLFARFFPLVLAFAAVVMVLAGLASMFRIVESHRTVAGERQMRWGREYLTVLRNRHFMVLMAGAVLSISIELQLGGYIAVRLAEHMPTQAILPGLVVTGVVVVGILRTGNTVLVVLLTHPARKLLRSMSDTARLVTGLVLFTIGFAALTASLHVPVLLLGLVVLTIGEILYVPEKQALVGNAIPAEARGIYTAVYSLNFAVGFLVASAVLSVSDLVAPSAITATVVLAGVACIGIFHWARSAAPEPVAEGTR